MSAPQNLWIGVSQDQGSPGAHEVEVAIAVHIGGISSLGFLDHGWHTAHGSKGTHGRADAAGQYGLGAFKPLF